MRPHRRERTAAPAAQGNADGAVLGGCKPAATGTGNSRPGDAEPIIVTHAGAAAGAARHPIDLGRQARLHFEFVGRFRGFGTLAAGWIADPGERVLAVSIRAGSAAPTEFGAGAALLPAPECREVFRIPRHFAAKYGFVVLAAEPEIEGEYGQTLEVRLEGGGIQRRVLPPAGSVAGLAQLVARAPLAYGLSVVRQILAGRRANDRRHGSLPEEIDALVLAVHQKIDPDYNYGSHGNGAAAECYVERVIRVGTAGMLVAGWIFHDDSDRVRELAVTSLNGRRVVFGAPVPAVARTDVVDAKSEQIASRNRDCGFIAFAAVPDLAGDDRAWFLELIMETGAIKRFPFICPPAPAPLHGIRASIALAQEKARDLPELFERAISPAVDWFWAKTRQDNPSPTELVFGNPPAGAEVSVIVPLYGRIDLMRYQVACFSNDPEFDPGAETVELIYVLDDPSAAGAAQLLFRHLHDVYGLPFRIMVMNRNLGYSAANNVGAAAATGTRVLFLNSDVLPIKPGWVSQLAASYRALDRCGILGCRLLFEDGSIQHAGMTFRPSTLVAGCWENDHPGKGLPTAFDPCRSPVVVPAVTAACLMIDRALFGELGGMSEEYVIGDFEDSDLCLRAQERGWNIYYTPETELFHLERQSMQLIADGEAEWRQSLTLYNMWKHSRRWGSLIPVILDRLKG